VNPLQRLFDNNQRWVEEMGREDPEFFSRAAAGQSPTMLWIGCADSRVPANQVVALNVGELFVHRNIANLVVHTDLNCLSVIEYAVEHLKVPRIIVCGHYRCGGIAAALAPPTGGLIDSWLLHIRDVANRHREELAAIDAELRADRLSELNVEQQVANVCQTLPVRRAWECGQELAVHGVVYDLTDGRLKDLGIAMSGPDEGADTLA
jgi:carbonic anhydrase